MRWMKRPKPLKTTFFIEEELLGDGSEAIAIEQHGEIFYVAERYNGEDRVRGLVVLTAEDGDTWMFREIAEEDGPMHFDASSDLLAALTPTGDEIARRWRTACEKKAAGLTVLDPYEGVDLEPTQMH